MLRQLTIAIVAICTVCIGCNPVQKKALLNEAKQIHKENTTIELQLSQKLKTLIQQKNSINIQGRALTSDELSFVDEIANLENSYLAWKKEFKTSASVFKISEDATIDALPKGLQVREILNTQENLKTTITSIMKKVDQFYETLSGDTALRPHYGKSNL